MHNVDELIDNIRRLRRVRNLSQRALAKKAGLSESCVAYCESGKKFPRVKTLFKFADALGLDIAQLFDTTTLTDEAT